MSVAADRGAATLVGATRSKARPKAELRRNNGRHGALMAPREIHGRGLSRSDGGRRNKYVLGHDDSAVDDDPEVDGPQRQQVRRIPPGAHGRGPRLFGGSYPDCFQRITIW